MQMEESKQILVAITELQTNMRTVITQINEIGKISTLALQTEQSTKSAHNRIDDLKGDFEKKLTEQNTDFEKKLAAQKTAFDKDIADECKAREKIEDNLKWIWRAYIGGTFTLVFGIVLYWVNTH